MEKLPQLLIHRKNDRLHSTAYLLKPLDKEEKEKYSFKGSSEEDFTLYIPTESINNQKDAFPTTGVVVAAFGDDPDFKEGDLVVVEQNVFRKSERKFRDWDIFWETEEHGELFRAFAIDTFVRIVDDSILVPRKGILICENVYKENYTTTLAIELPESAKTKRRDIVRVVTTWDGEDCEYNVGDYLLIHRSADWRFNHNGKELIKIDTYFDDVVAVVYTDKWGQPKIDNKHY